jgi:exonuclease SbcC
VSGRVGTLDSETLEVALSALENLQSTGKTIGLISHVDLLKERLDRLSKRMS